MTMTDRMAGILGSLGLLFFVVLITTLTVFIARADGRVDYCYIEAYSPSEVARTFYKLHQHRPWRADYTAGIFDSHEACVEAARRQDCPLK
jgi:hypothetical protein